MGIKIDSHLTAEKLRAKCEALFELSSAKIVALEKTWKPGRGTPVFTQKGKYSSRGWTEWTQGFQFGSALLQFDATGEKSFLEIGRRKTIELMASHVSHRGVHDHGFNNISTYGNLWRLMREGKIPRNENENDFYELALKISGAVQAMRWTALADGQGFIYSFNGPHSLFVDTMRTLRSLALAHQLGHVLMSERDEKVSLFTRLVQHANTTARYSIYYGEGRDAYDVPGRTAHESVFNVNDGSYRCPNSQQGYSPFTTWTRGLAWAMLGYAEQLEFLSARGADDGARAFPSAKSLARIESTFLRAATSTTEFFIKTSCADGIPMWDTGAPDLYRMRDTGNHAADPFNQWEPVDSSAAVIAAQGMLRLGNYLARKGNNKAGNRYRKAAFTVADTLFAEPYLSTSSRHQGLLLHSVYHRPNGWDYIAPGQKVPNGESSMWGDYHARELALLLLREAKKETYMTFFGLRAEC
jgi:unsaturated chondroitin disaccharide hydrolase